MSGRKSVSTQKNICETRLNQSDRILYSVCMCVCLSVTAGCMLSLHWQAACESVNGGVFHTLPTDASSQFGSTVLSHPSGIIDAFWINLMTPPFKSSPRHYQLMCFEVPVHTHTHLMCGCNTPDFAGWTWPITSCSHQTWHEAAGFLYHTYFGREATEHSMNKTPLLLF